MGETFGARLRAAIEKRGRLCVGIDPHAALLAEWGLSDDARGLETFAMTAVDALAGEVAVLKPQSAFFERHGAAGIAVLERTVREARDAGALVLLDVKRGDIGSTAAAYADAYLHPESPISCDAITVSPYLGFGSLDPFLDAADRYGRGVFVLALTSNPEGPEVQHARVEGGTVAGSVLAQIALRNGGADPLGSIGAVVGATIGDLSEEVAINGPLLVPGLGAQGGTPADLRRLFGDVYANVLPATARAVLAAGPEVSALRDAARRTAVETSR
ncbi:orotidine-5'-phosphate decarboxylase [Solicola gregarius]|uniref:Orotidine 5'-phosphate decarboxylase n=1 Tax=Solicola gregarius TaxID=2908642 RepID=A0AA46THB6_9ACTN|nr:orotidine-5'-phosphate decarboxylase [Solicola gregarius]UYM04849.1 orotidine-5'-phosphate decarboxylase [Solicola gregarius]